jgi:hypothetical protein
LRIFKFQGPSRTQIDLGFLERKYFITRNIWGGRSQRDEAQGPNEHRWCGHQARPRHPYSLAAQASAAVYLHLQMLSMT